MKVGDVDSLHFQKDLKHVDVRIRMNADMEGHLGKGTEFWIAGATPSLTESSSLKSIISGPTIGISPRPGPKQAHYDGLSQPPVEQESIPGRHFVLHAAALGNLSRGSHVYFKDLDVGIVEDTTLKPDRNFELAVFIKSPFDRLVHTGTRFWNAGAVQLSMQGNGPKLQLQSVPALLQGAVDFDTPAAAARGPAGARSARFRIVPGKDTAEYAPGAQAVAYRVVFQAAAGGLDAGAPVQLAGKRVGTVTESTLEYDPRTAKLYERVGIAIEPGRIVLADGSNWPDNARAPMDALISKLIGQGLRAQLGASVPVVGAKDVELAFVQGAPQASLIPGDPPEIPTQQGGGGIDGIMTAVSQVAGKIDSLPLDQIGDNIRTITTRIAELAKSPEADRHAGQARPLGRQCRAPDRHRRQTDAANHHRAAPRGDTRRMQPSPRRAP